MKKCTLIILMALLYSCNGTRLDKVFKSQSPYEQYMKDLSESPLKNSAMVMDWLAAGERALSDSTFVTLPYQELGYFDPNDPSALGLRFPVQEGQQLIISLSSISEPDIKFFIDLFDIRSDGTLSRNVSAAENHSISEKITRDGIKALRIQPELLKGGVFELQIDFTGSIAFPIPEKSSLNISSFFGDARDAGGRKHEGVDVFAPRGTPVVAVDDGRVSRVGNNRLGGKTVSLYANNYSFYYAHLDSQLVNMGQRVNAGDTLGLVGNTGNAITTAPHLHFGIYATGRRSVDPLYFFRNAPDLAPIDFSDSTEIGNYGRIKGNLANIRQAPNTESNILTQLQRNNVLHIDGKTGDWYRVKLPDNLRGFISASLLDTVENSLKTIVLNPEDRFKSNWNNIVYQSEYETGEAELLGEFQSFNLVRKSDGRLIWHQPGSDEQVE